MNAKIQLKDGGTYVNSLGQPVTVQQTNDGAFPFEQSNGDPMVFMADGRYVEDESPCSVYNLVAEAPRC